MTRETLTTTIVLHVPEALALFNKSEFGMKSVEHNGLQWFVSRVPEVTERGYAIVALKRA